MTTLSSYGYRMIRNATQQDIPALQALIQTAITTMQAQGIAQWDSLYPGRTEIEADLAQETLFVLEEGNRVVGCITLDDDQPQEYQAINWSIEGTAAVVHRLCVHPDHQGKGYARPLMAFAEHTAREQGFASIRLDAFSGNPAACGLYPKLGYRQLGSVRFRMGEFFCFDKSLVG